MNRIPFIIAVLTFCVGIGFSNAELYKWVDKDGVEHFSNSAPENSGVTSVETEDEIIYDPSADAEREAQDQKTMEAVDKEQDQMISETKKENEQAAQQEKAETPATPVIVEDESDDEYFKEHERRREEALHDTNRLNEPVRKEDPEIRHENELHKKQMR